MWKLLQTFLLVVVGVTYAATSYFWQNALTNDIWWGQFGPFALPGFIGRGPCPDNGDPCLVDFEKLPTSVKALGITGCGSSVLNTVFGGSCTLGALIPSGYMKLSRTQFSRLVMSSISIVSSNCTVNPNPTAACKQIRVQLVGLKFSLNSLVTLDNIPLPVVPVSTPKVFLALNVQKNTMGAGSDIDMNFTVQSISKAPYSHANDTATNVVNTIGLANDSCKMTFNLGTNPVGSFDINLPGVDSLNVAAFVNALFVDIIQPLIGDLVCGSLRQLIRLSDGSDGFISEKLNEFYFATMNLTTALPDIRQEELQYTSTKLTAAEKANALVFGTSDIVKGVADTVNPWLGGTGPGIVINEFVNLATRPDNGTFVVGNLETLGLDLKLELDALFLTVTLRNASIGGLNTFNKLSILNRPFLTDVLNYTLSHEIDINNLRGWVILDLTIEDSTNPYVAQSPTTNRAGSWKTDRIYDSCPGETASCAAFPGSATTTLAHPNRVPLVGRLNVSFDLDGLQLDLATTILTNPKENQDLTLGQILGKSNPAVTTFGGQVNQARKCLASSTYGVFFPDFRVGLSSISSPPPGFRVTHISPPSVPGGVAGERDTGLEGMLSQATDAILTVLDGTILKMPQISSSFLRPRINDLIEEVIDSGKGIAPDCPDYVSLGLPIYPNLVTSRIFKTISSGIRDAIGGNPVVNTKANINELMKYALELVVRSFNLNATTSGGNITLFSGITVKNGANFMGVGDLRTPYIKVSNLDSVVRFTVEGTSSPNQFDLLFELGSAAKPLLIEIAQDWFVDYNASFIPGGRIDINEQGLLRIRLEGFNLSMRFDTLYNLDELYQLRPSQLLKPACVLAPLVKANITGSMKVSTFNLHYFRTGSSVLNSPYKLAMVALAAAGTTSRVNELNFVLKSVLDSVIDAVSNFDSTVTVSNCEQQPSALSSVLLNLIVAGSGKNLSDIVDKLLGKQGPPDAYAVSEAMVEYPFGSVIYNWQTGTFGTLISNVAKQITPQIWSDLIFTLANQTGDVLSDIIVPRLPGYNYADLVVNFTKYSFMDRNVATGGFDLSALINGSKLFLTYLSISNINTLNMTALKLLTPVSPMITETLIFFPQGMDVVLKFEVDFPAAFLSPVSPAFTETFQVDISLTKLLIDIDMLLAINTVALNQLSVGHFLSLNPDGSFKRYDQMISCLISAVYKKGFFFPKFQIDTYISNLALTTSNNLIPATMETYLNVAANVVVDMFNANWYDITQGALREFINIILLEPLTTDGTFCGAPPAPVLLPGKEYLNFQTSNVATFIQNLTQNYLAGTSKTYVTLNGIINGLLNDRIFFTTLPRIGFENVPIVYKRNDLGYVSGSISDMRIENLGSFKDIGLLKVLTNASFDNDLQIAGPTKFSIIIRYRITDLFVDGNPGRRVRQLEERWGEDYGTSERDLVQNVDLYDDLKISITVTNLTFGAEVYMRLLLPQLLDIQASSLTSLSELPCVLQTVEDLRVSNVQFDLSNIALSISCGGNCTSPVFAALQSGGSFTTSGGEDSIIQLVPDLIEYTLKFYTTKFAPTSPPNGLPTPAPTTNTIACARALNLTTVVAVLNAPVKKETNVAVIFGLALCGAGVACVALLPLLVPRHQQLKDKMVAEQLGVATKLFQGNGPLIAKFMAKRERESIPLGFHPTVTPFFRVLIPVVCLSNILMLGLSFTVYLSFSIDAIITLLGVKTEKITAVPWTISSTLNDFWASGAWPLTLLVVFASCAWPVVKNALLLMVWYLPSTLLSHDFRMKFLIVLDVLGKWSVLDAYIIVIIVAALRLTLSVAAAPILQSFPIPETTLIIDVTVIPAIGIVLLVLAAFCSLAINHVIIWRAIHAQWSDARLFKQMDGEEDDVLSPKAEIRLVLADYVFSTVTPGGQRDRYGPKAKNYITIMLVTCFFSVLIVQFLPYLVITQDGLVGFAVAFFISGGRKIVYSLATLGLKLMTGSDGTAESTLLFLFFVLIYYVTVCIAPLLNCVLYLILWLRPLSLKDQKTILFFAKVAAYWSCLECFATAAAATTIEISVITVFFADFLTGGACGALKPTLQGIFGSVNGACLASGAALEYGFYLSLMAFFYTLFASVVVLRATQCAIRDREDVLENRPHLPYDQWEYKVLDKLLVHGAAHHKPVVNPNAVKKKWDNPVATLKEECDCTQCCTCFNGIDDIGINTFNKQPGQTGTNNKKVANSSVYKTSKWNVATPGQSQQWNAPQSQQWNMPQSQQWGMQQQVSGTYSQQSGYAMPGQMQMQQPGMMESVNPVFAREAERTNNRFSVDV